MKKEVLDFHAEFCKTFSNSRRLEIINLLKTGELSAGHITKELGIPKANTSQHLSVMRKMRILKTRRDGINIYYRIANNNISVACSLMQDALAQLMENSPVHQQEHI
ncbi:MAG: winged helix-turn-helix transcriptional regulator [Nitrospirae bacterium]|nr:winged helix-turn-helix transcriptional regulator [Nitrospirota bacterium]